MSTPARRLARRLLEPRPGAGRTIPLGPASGLTFDADPIMPLDFWLGLYESELSPWLRRLCGAGTRCVDVGSYNAYHALVFAKLTGERVVSYDPDPASVARSRRNMALNPTLAPLIELRAIAVGAAGGPAMVTLDEELLPQAQRAPPATWMLKIDVDGAEVQVLKGAAGFLARTRPHVLVETHGQWLEGACGRLLLEAGYSPRVVTQRRLLPQDRSWPRGTPVHNRWLVAVGARAKPLRPD